jgi:hypothetical protein
MYPYAYPSIDPGAYTALTIIFFAGELMIASQILAAYLLPSFIAIGRQLPDSKRITMINIGLGWTIGGWIWAVTHAIGEASPPPDKPEPDPYGLHQQPPPQHGETVTAERNQPGH